MSHSGGCFCGQIRYEITGKPLNVTVCHCPGCKKSSGAGALPWVTVKTAEFRLTRGTLAEVRSDQFPQASCDGCGGTRTFCTKCGTPISFLGDGGRAEREIDVTLGSLDDPAVFTPREDVFGENKLEWIKPVKP
ncbi:MAG: GFA family protein [Phycisphaeraceae bacterium]|nr:GFA family protein [Phycisphaeraceae bacterium]